MEYCPDRAVRKRLHSTKFDRSRANVCHVRGFHFRQPQNTRRIGLISDPAATLF
jgi:hypothetical protein